MSLMLLVENLVKVAVHIHTLRSLITLFFQYSLLQDLILGQNPLLFFFGPFFTSHQCAGQLLVAGHSSDSVEFVELGFWWCDVAKCGSLPRFLSRLIQPSRSFTPSCYSDLEKIFL